MNHKNFDINPWISPCSFLSNNIFNIETYNSIKSESNFKFGLLLNHPRRSSLLLKRMRNRKEFYKGKGFTYSKITKMMSSTHRASPEEIIQWLDMLVDKGILECNKTVIINQNKQYKKKCYYKFIM